MKPKIALVLALTCALDASAYTQAERAAYLAARGASGMYGADGRNFYVNPYSLIPVIADPVSYQAIEHHGFTSACVDVLPFLVPTATSRLPEGTASQASPREATAPEFVDNTARWKLSQTWGTHNPKGYTYSGYTYWTKFGDPTAFEYLTWDPSWIYRHQDNTSTPGNNNIQYTGYLRNPSVWYQGATNYPRYMCVGMVVNTPRVIHRENGQIITLNAASVMVNRYWKVWGAGINGGRPTETIELAVLQDPDRRASAVKYGPYLSYSYADVTYYVRGYGPVAWESSVLDDPKHDPVAWTWPTAIFTRPAKRHNRNPYVYDMFWGMYLP